MKTIISMILVLAVLLLAFYFGSDQYAYQERVVYHAIGREYIIRKDTVLIVDGNPFNGDLLTEKGVKIDYRMFYPDFYEHKNPYFDLDKHDNK